LQPEGLHYIKEERRKGGERKEEGKEGEKNRKREEEDRVFHQLLQGFSVPMDRQVLILSALHSRLNKDTPACPFCHQPSDCKCPIQSALPCSI
jgi:hypothetical protein